MIFHSTWAFLFLLPLFAVVGWIIWTRNKRYPSIQFSQVHLIKQQAQTMRARLMILPTLLKILAIIFAVVALARPQKSDTLVKKNIEGIDIMMVLDISDSMLIEDMKPTNRIEAAKSVMRAFIEKRSSDRIGVIIFAGESFTLVPLTLDYQLILDRISKIETAQDAHIKDGTAIGVALANAANRLKESTAKSRVMIFMTDGENNCGTIDPETGLEVAKGYGIKIYSMGLGKDGMAKLPVPQKDAFGNRVMTYIPFESTVNEALLKKMADDTGGRYYRANKENSLVGIFNEIDSLEKTKIDVNKFTRYSELFPPYLLIALCLYLLAFVLEKTFLRRTP